MQIYLPTHVARRMRRHAYLQSIDIEKLRDNPVCPRCERAALRDRGWAEEKIGHCPYCGHRGPMPITVGEYAENKLYK